MLFRSELSLTPGMNVMDGFLTSHLERTFYKHESDLIREYLGAPEDIIECPTPSQRALFGPTRRRVPKMVDLANPVLLGPVQNQEHYMQGVVARRNNFVEPILDFFEAAYKDFAALTGRYYGLVSQYKCDDAETVFVALGSAAENIEAAVDYLRQREGEVGAQPRRDRGDAAAGPRGEQVVADLKATRPDPPVQPGRSRQRAVDHDRGHEVVDVGPATGDVSVDYPDYGAAVGRAVTRGDADLGVAICGSGIGISIAANKIAGVRAALVHDATSARLAREHNHANVLCLGARLIGLQVALDALDAWLNATPGDGRHLGRIDKLSQLDI